ncbi:MAG: hypothetical protein AB7V27_14700 [Candidatus Binatia bacterium]
MRSVAIDQRAHRAYAPPQGELPHMPLRGRPYGFALALLLWGAGAGLAVAIAG